MNLLWISAIGSAYNGDALSFHLYFHVVWDMLHRDWTIATDENLEMLVTQTQLLFPQHNSVCS